MTTVVQVLHQGGSAGSVISTLYLSLGLAVQVFTCGLSVRLVLRKLQPGARRSNARALESLLTRHPADVINCHTIDRTAALYRSILGSKH
jgi:hypothetical protein